MRSSLELPGGKNFVRSGVNPLKKAKKKHVLLLFNLSKLIIWKISMTIFWHLKRQRASAKNFLFSKVQNTKNISSGKSKKLARGNPTEVTPLWSSVLIASNYRFLKKDDHHVHDCLKLCAFVFNNFWFTRKNGLIVSLSFFHAYLISSIIIFTQQQFWWKSLKSQFPLVAVSSDNSNKLWEAIIYLSAGLSPPKETAKVCATEFDFDSAAKTLKAINAKLTFA